MHKKISFKTLSVFTITSEIIGQVVLHIVPVLGSAIFTISLLNFFLSIVIYFKEKVNNFVYLAGFVFLYGILLMLIPTPQF